jgi:hypothetical protein
VRYQEKERRRERLYSCVGHLNSREGTR